MTSSFFFSSSPFLVSSFLLHFPHNLSIPSSLPPHPFLLPFLHLILILFLPPLVSLLSFSFFFLFSSCFLVLFLFFLLFSLYFFYLSICLSPVSPGACIYVGIKEVFIDRDNNVFSAPALCFCSHKKPGEHITETLADSVSNVKLCGGRGQVSSIVCQVHVQYMCYSVST